MTRAVTAPRAFDLGREHGSEPLRVEGALPADLRGTLYRNGPRRFSDTNAAHWFDGVGGVAAVRLGGGRAEGAVRLVSTPEVDADRRGRPRYGAFAAKAAWDKRLAVLFGRRGFKNLANINVLAWQGRLFALYEALNPLELHPETLASLGESTLGGALRNGFQAHPHRVPERRATYALGMNIGPGPRCTLDLVELPDQGPARRLTTLPLDGVREVHDFAVTERHAVIVVPPLSAPAWKVALHGTFAATVTWDEAAGCEVIVVPLDAPARARRFKTDAFFAWHWANGWELGDGRIGLDVVRYEPWTGPWLPPESVVSGGFPPLAAPPGTRPTLWRATVDPARERFELGPLWEAARCEFPSVAPSQVGA
ncbi:MAG: carotenoid oxygenase family protein, partial [Myxococcales bacterium]|nr:carotenoid oxygenase family protein [Myxococcales bacterium]